MICPKCAKDRERIVDTDDSHDGRETVRCHRCLSCGHYWITRELHAARLQGPIPPTYRRVDRARSESTSHN